jgi:hypothetical protein
MTPESHLAKIDPNFKEKDDEKNPYILPHGSMEVTIRINYTKRKTALPAM